MKHFRVSISNRKSTGENDSSSTRNFIVSVRRESDTGGALARSVDEVLKIKSQGLFLPIAWTQNAVEIEGEIAGLGKPLIRNDEFEVREDKY